MPAALFVVSLTHAVGRKMAALTAVSSQLLNKDFKKAGQQAEWKASVCQFVSFHSHQKDPGSFFG